MADPQNDLDAFLTSIESKLRGPFSSLDLTKAVSTPALRGSSTTAQEYLHRISQVMSRADKVTQMGILIGLLGLEPSEEIDAELEQMLQQSQEAPVYEEWVRIISCLVQNVVFQQPGEEAESLLDKTCNEIIDRVMKVIYETEGVDTDQPACLSNADADPTFAPFRYALLKPSILKAVIPEAQKEQHGFFQINADADILTMDARLEQQKAHEEREHATTTAASSLTSRSKSTASEQAEASAVAAKAQAADAPIFPGFKSTADNKTTNNKLVAKPKASMFMPSKKPMFNKPSTLQQKQAPTSLNKPTSLHTRKAGAAQLLLGRKKALMAGGIATAGGGRALLHNNRSKMRMIDVAEVQDLSKQQQQQQEAGVGAKKRKAESAQDASEGKSTKAKIGDLVEAQTKVLPDVAAAAAAAALSAYQRQTTAETHDETIADQQQEAPPQQQPTTTPQHDADASHPRQQDWRQMLKEKSNRLTADDRFRIQQFFQDKFNPTPDQLMYKMKLHEERLSDRKETYYLELDYNTFTSKQSKKTKRYKEETH